MGSALTCAHVLLPNLYRKSSLVLHKNIIIGRCLTVIWCQSGASHSVFIIVLELELLYSSVNCWELPFCFQTPS